MASQRHDTRSFDVVAWPAERRLVLYVPEIEAATTVAAMPDADAAARSLIADLTGLDAGAIRCEITLGRAPGGFGGPAQIGWPPPGLPPG
ncbi:hypothetical protein [Pseudonocardia sp. GCM10023141]|uniref:hypothetical protein n=1 Tax=Pseudonocardia sp. GCM10023141 TaxID=3252653 RepID=UPI003619A03C